MLTLMKQNRTTWFELIFVNNRKDRNIKVKTLVRRNDTVAIVNNFLKVSNSKRGTTKLVNFYALFLLIFILRFEQLLILNKLLLHE